MCSASSHTRSRTRSSSNTAATKTNQEVQHLLNTLPQSLTLDELFQVVLHRPHDARPSSLAPHHDALRLRVSVDPPSAPQLAHALSRLVAARGLIAPEDHCFLLSVLSPWLLRTPPASCFTSLALTQALVSLDGLPHTAPDVQQFRHALQPLVSHSSTHGRLITPKDLSSQLRLLRFCHDHRVAEQVLDSVIASLGGSAGYPAYKKRALSSQPPYNPHNTSGQELCQVIFNLQGLSCECLPKLKLVLDVIACWTRAGNATWSPSEWSRALCGMSSLNSSSPEATALLGAIAEKMQLEVRSDEGSGELRPRHLSQAMYGLRYMDSKHPTVMLVIRNITTAIETLLTGSFEGKDLARVLFGLKTMSSQESCVRDLCRALAEKMSNENIRLGSLQNIDLTMACRGLEKLSSEREEVRQLVRVLAQAWRGRQACPEAGVLASAPFTGQMVSQALYGLQLMDNRHEEVEMLVRELVNTMRQGRRGDEAFTDSVCSSIGKDLKLSTYHAKHRSTDSINVKELCNALYGLRSMCIAASASGCSDSADLVEDILTSMDAANSTLDSSPRHAMNQFRDNSNLLEAVLSGLLDRCGQIRHALALETGPDKGGEEPWLQLEPRHLAHALYGLQLLGPVQLSPSPPHALHTVAAVDHTSDIVSLLFDAHEALAAHAQAHQQGRVAGGLTELERWTPYRMHDCLHGMLAIDTSSNEKARRLLSFLLRMTKALAQQEQPQLSRGPGGDRNGHSRQYLKLYHSLLFFETKAVMGCKQYDAVTSQMPKNLYNRLTQAITAVEERIHLQPLQPQSSQALVTYSSFLREILDAVESPSVFNDKGYAFRLREDRRPRKIKAFFNTYLHSFHADIVVVGYYTKETKAELMMRSDETKTFGGSESGGGGSLLDSLGKYTPDSKNTGKIGGGSGRGSDGVLSEFESFVQHVYSPEDLVVVNVEIDGPHKTIIGNRSRDLHRDAYLLEMHNIAVERIDVCEKHKVAPVSRLGPIVDAILDSN